MNTKTYISSLYPWSQCYIRSLSIRVELFYLASYRDTLSCLLVNIIIPHYHTTFLYLLKLWRKKTQLDIMIIFHPSQAATTMCFVAHFGVILDIVSIIDESTLWSRTLTFENWDYEYSRTDRIPNQRKSTLLTCCRIYNYHRLVHVS